MLAVARCSDRHAVRNSRGHAIFTGSRAECLAFVISRLACEV